MKKITAWVILGSALLASQSTYAAKKKTPKSVKAGATAESGANECGNRPKTPPEPGDPAKLDRIIREVSIKTLAKTEAGRSWMKTAFDCRPNLIWSAIGADPETAARIAEECRDAPNELALLRGSGCSQPTAYRPSQVTDEAEIAWLSVNVPHQYSISHSRTFGKIDSWTTGMFNMTYLFLPKDYSTWDVTKRFIHENYLFSDGATYLLAEATQKKQLKTPEGSEINDQQLNDLMHVLNDTYLRTAFVAARALTMERNVLSQMKDVPPSELKEYDFIRTNSPAGCKETLKTLHALIQRDHCIYDEAAKEEDKMGARFRQASARLPKGQGKPPEFLSSLDKTLDWLSSFRVKSDGQEMSLCELLTRPSIRTYPVRTEFGPRPCTQCG